MQNIINIMNLERPTEELISTKNKYRINIQHQISESVQSRLWKKTQSYFQQYFSEGSIGNKLNEKNLQNLQMIYQKSLVNIYSGDKEKGIKILRELLQKCQKLIQTNLKDAGDSEEYLFTLMFRIRLSLLCIGVKYSSDDPTFKEQIELCQKISQFVKEFPIYKRQVIGRLTGCPSIKLMEEINSEYIERQTNQSKKAIMFNRVSQWKYMINRKQQSIHHKRKSLQIWQKLNKLKQTKKIQNQIKQILSSSKTAYIKRLQFLASSISMFRDISDKTSLTGGIAAKTGFAITLKKVKTQLNSIANTPPPKNSSYLPSKKQNQLRDQIIFRVQIAEKFYKKQFKIKTLQRNISKYSNTFAIPSQVCFMLYGSKFVDVNEKILRRYFLIFSKLVSKEKKDIFFQLRNFKRQKKNEKESVKGSLKGSIRGSIKDIFEQSLRESNFIKQTDSIEINDK